MKYQQINSIAQAIKRMIDRGEGYNRKLMYALHKNMRIITNELEVLDDSLHKHPEEYKTYRRELFELAIECGGEQMGGEVRMDVEGFDKDTFFTKSNELKDKYKDVIKEGELIDKRNKEFLEEHEIEIEWFKLQLDWFPEELSSKDMPYELFDLIEEN